MSPFTTDVAFSPAVKAAQEARGSRELYARYERERGWASRITPELTEFITSRDFLFMATASRDGQPYIQHRGGPRGFLKVIDDRTIAFADFAGNRQYITVGNLTENPRATLFLMDQPTRNRWKIWGRAEVVEDDPELLDAVTDPDYRARPERVIRFTVEAFDRNCPQHITPRFTEAEFAPVVDELRTRIRDLETENRLLHEGRDT